MSSRAMSQPRIAGSEAGRNASHCRADCWRSTSPSITARPWRASSPATLVARVLLPTPPLGLAITITGMRQAMNLLECKHMLLAATLAGGATAALAGGPGCDGARLPRVSFVQFSSPNIAASPPSLLTVKGKLSLPARQAEHRDTARGHGCGTGQPRKLPAVLILHGSSGVDARGDFHEAALNAAGIATLQIDMWEARGVASAAERPKAPILTLPDAFSALAYLASRAEIDPQRIGVLGFSWGGVNAMAAAERAYVGMFGAGRQFKAHVAHYPVCYAYNNPVPGLPPPAQMGTQFVHLTGAPVLIQVGSLDDYDKRRRALPRAGTQREPRQRQCGDGGRNRWRLPRLRPTDGADRRQRPLRQRRQLLHHRRRAAGDDGT
jgi:dienelactone hydrolase